MSRRHRNNRRTYHAPPAARQTTYVDVDDLRWGDLCAIDGTEQVSPQTHATLGRLQVFLVLSRGGIIHLRPVSGEATDPDVKRLRQMPVRYR